jgi:cytochrome b pre-mRNA-processing protein 3
MSWLRRDPARKTAKALYAALVAQARRPEFYARLGVPDSLDGRFEMVALHMFIVLRRLKASPAQSSGLAQALVDLFVEDMDASLREMGAGDLGVGRRVKRMAQALYGRIAAYEKGLAGPEELLIEALRRNLYATARGDREAESATQAALAGYLRRESAGPAPEPKGLLFGPPPAAGPGAGR